jgi:thermitase
MRAICHVSLRFLIAILLLCGSVVHAAAGQPTRPPRQAGDSGAPNLSGGTAGQDDAAALVPGEVVIGWQPDPAARAQAQPGRRFRPSDVDRTSHAWRTAAASLAARSGLAVLDLIPEYGLARLSVRPGGEAAEIARLAALPWVTHAGPNYLAQAAGYPNDPRIGEQWHMRRIGAPAAWDLTFGSYSIVIAVIDSGVDLGHPEFAGRLLPGFDYVNWDDTPNDDNGHGTHVTGIIAAAANNKSGVAGLAANVAILPLKVLDSQGGGNYYNIAAAIRRAADRNVQVINLSLGGFSDDVILQDAIKYATDRNIFVAAAAGNCGQGGTGCNGANPIYYPAAYPGAFAVAASDHFDNWANYSGYKYYVALAAPGGLNGDEIVSTLPGGYGWKFGTSMATAQASAAAALVRTYQPAATHTQVADILKNTADKVGPYTYVGGRNDWFGAGRLNVGRAVRWAYPPSLRSTVTSHRFLLGEPITQASITLPILNESDQPVTWQATELTGATWLRLTPGRGVTSFSAADTLILQAGPTALAPGEYDAIVQVRAIPAAAATAAQIYVTLKIAGGVQRYFNPLIANQMQAAQWVDPAAGGIAIYPTNDTPYQVGLPFPVTFYGQNRNALSISFKGYASFTQAGSGAAVAQSSCLPTAALPNDAIYALWQDWNPALGGQVFIHYPDADRFVVTWFQMRRFLGDLPHSFQLVLFRDGGLMLQYRAVQTPVQGTIGIENWDGTVATQIACNGVGRLPAAGDAISLTAQLPWGP